MFQEINPHRILHLFLDIQGVKRQAVTFLRVPSPCAEHIFRSVSFTSLLSAESADSRIFNGGLWVMFCWKWLLRDGGFAIKSSLLDFLDIFFRSDECLLRGGCLAEQLDVCDASASPPPSVSAGRGRRVTAGLRLTPTLTNPMNKCCILPRCWGKR